MAHWAEIVDGIVTRVLVTDNEMPNEGYDWLVDNLGGMWVKTSYNTFAGVHSEGGEPLRYNFAGIGFAYDSGRDAFIPPKPSDDATLDEQTCRWIVPEV
jgi:hypothetical protein